LQQLDESWKRKCAEIRKTMRQSHIDDSKATKIHQLETKFGEFIASLDETKVERNKLAIQLAIANNQLRQKIDEIDSLRDINEKNEAKCMKLQETIDQIRIEYFDDLESERCRYNQLKAESDDETNRLQIQLTDSMKKCQSISANNDRLIELIDEANNYRSKLSIRLTYESSKRYNAQKMTRRIKLKLAKEIRIKNIISSNLKSERKKLKLLQERVQQYDKETMYRHDLQSKIDQLLTESDQIKLHSNSILVKWCNNYIAIDNAQFDTDLCKSYANKTSKNSTVEIDNDFAKSLIAIRDQLIENDWIVAMDQICRIVFRRFEQYVSYQRAADEKIRLMTVNSCDR
jgi:hypothetical protein